MTSWELNYLGKLGVKKIKKAPKLCTAPKKLDTSWGHFYGQKKKV